MVYDGGMCRSGCALLLAAIGCAPGSPSTVDWTTRGMEGAWERPRWEERWFPQAFKGTMGQLMRAIQEDADPAISGRTTLGTMTLVEAAYRSLHEGRAVPVAAVTAESFGS